MIWNKSRKCPSGKGKKMVKERNPVQRSSGKLCQGKGVTRSCRRKVGLSLYTHPSHSPPETLTLDSPDMDQHSTPSTQLQLYLHSLLIPLSFSRRATGSSLCSESHELSLRLTENVSFSIRVPEGLLSLPHPLWN